MTFLTVFGVWKYHLVLEGKTGKEIPKSSRLEFLEMFLANNVYQMKKAVPPGR